MTYHHGGAKSGQSISQAIILSLLLFLFCLFFDGLSAGLTRPHSGYEPQLKRCGKPRIVWAKMAIVSY